jgi:chromate transporter
MRFFAHFKDNAWLMDILSGIKPAAVGLIAAAAITIATDVLIAEGQAIGSLLTDPIGTLSLTCAVIFILTAILNIRFKVNPILLTVLAGIAGAILNA